MKIREGLRVCGKTPVLKGHGFNRAERATEEMAALAAEAVSWRDRSLSNRVEHVV
jgi:hypothetical protein